MSGMQALSAWRKEQTLLSSAVGVVGAIGLAAVLLGTPALLVANGLTPFQSIVDTFLSGPLTTLLWIAIVLGGAAAAAGFGSFKRMPTKVARETAISGAALGVQAVVLGGLVMWFRSGARFDLVVRQNFSFEILGQFGRDFLTGAKNTVILAGGGEALGIALGLVLALLILSQRIVVRAPARAYINFFRGTPLIWQLAFGYVLLRLSLRLPLDVFQVGIIVLGLNAGAYSAEVFRAGIQSIERGQIEGARSLGMSYLQAMRYVILPQAIRRVIPPLTNEFIILIKDTSLIFVLGLVAAQRELFSVARDAYSQTFNATPYIGAVLGYLAITLPMIRVVTALERRMRSGLTGIVGM